MLVLFETVSALGIAPDSWTEFLCALRVIAKDDVAYHLWIRDVPHWQTASVVNKLA